MKNGKSYTKKVSQFGSFRNPIRNPKKAEGTGVMKGNGAKDNGILQMMVGRSYYHRIGDVKGKGGAKGTGGERSERRHLGLSICKYKSKSGI